MELESVLGRIAERIVENGTLAEARVLQAMSAATQEVCPGAAAALVDWNGSEIARLRAFGVVHGVVLRVLARRDQSGLLDQVLGTADPHLSGEAGLNRSADPPQHRRTRPTSRLRLPTT